MEQIYKSSQKTGVFSRVMQPSELELLEELEERKRAEKTSKSPVEEKERVLFDREKKSRRREQDWSHIRDEKEDF